MSNSHLAQTSHHNLTTNSTSNNNSAASPSAFARAKALALEKTSRLKENSAQFSELAKEKGARWGAKAAASGKELKNQSNSWFKNKEDGSDAGDTRSANNSANGSEQRKSKKKGAGSNAPAAELAVFAIPLTQAVQASRLDEFTALPGVVVRCIEFLDAKGLDEVGLYRIPGSTSTVNKLRHFFDTGGDMEFVDAGEDPNAVATLLKMFLRELPESILTSALETEFQEVFNNYDYDKSVADSAYDASIVDTLAALTNRLPEENYQLLAWLMCHLARVDYYSDVNKMNSSNLGLIFCPTLGITSVLFRYLVSHCERILPLPRNGGSQAYLSESPLGGTGFPEVPTKSEEEMDSVFYDVSDSVLGNPPECEPQKETESRSQTSSRRRIDGSSNSVSDDVSTSKLAKGQRKTSIPLNNLSIKTQPSSSDGKASTLSRSNSLGGAVSFGDLLALDAESSSPDHHARSKERSASEDPLTSRRAPPAASLTPVRSHQARSTSLNKRHTQAPMSNSGGAGGLACNTTTTTTGRILDEPVSASSIPSGLSSAGPPSRTSSPTPSNRSASARPLPHVPVPSSLSSSSSSSTRPNDVIAPAHITLTKTPLVASTIPNSNLLPSTSSLEPITTTTTSTSSQQLEYLRGGNNVTHPPNSIDLPASSSFTSAIPQRVASSDLKSHSQPLSSPGAYSPVAGTGAVLGLVSADGEKLRDSAALFDYFFDEATKRINAKNLEESSTSSSSATGANDAVSKSEYSLMD